MYRRKVILIGPMPPPAGGISIHIWRLSHLLSNDFEVGFVDELAGRKQHYFNIRSMRLMKYFRILSGADTVHIHSGSNLLRIFHLITGKLLFKRVVLTLHAYAREKKFILRTIDEFFYSLADRVIVVNENILTRISLPPGKCVVRNAFIPPVLKEEPELPQVVEKWLRSALALGKLVICANAWRLDQFNNQDLYGLDMCIEVGRRLKNRGLQIAFVFNIATMDRFENLYNGYQEAIIKAGLENTFLLINERLSFVRLMSRSHIVVRPTNTDGDSVTIREALFLGKPVIASDVVERPAGTLLFSNRDMDNFENKLLEVIHLLTDGGDPVKLIDVTAGNDHQFYRELYHTKH